MEVTFRANSNVLGYRAGEVYTEELTPLLRAVILNDKHLSLIDPPNLEILRPVPQVPEVRRPEPQETENKKTKIRTGKTPVENKETDDDGREEREEGIQDSGSSGAS